MWVEEAAVRSCIFCHACMHCAFVSVQIIGIGLKFCGYKCLVGGVCVWVIVCVHVCVVLWCCNGILCKIECRVASKFHWAFKTLRLRRLGWVSKSL